MRHTQHLLRIFVKITEFLVSSTMFPYFSDTTVFIPSASSTGDTQQQPREPFSVTGAHRAGTLPLTLPNFLSMGLQ